METSLRYGRLWEPPQGMGQEMAVESRCSGPGSRVEHPPTVGVDILAVELSMMTCTTKSILWGSGQAQCDPCRGGKLQRPKDLREGGHGSDWKPREDLGPARGPVSVSSVSQAGGTSRPKMLAILGVSSQKCYGSYPWKAVPDMPPDRERDLEMYEGADDQLPGRLV